MISLTRVTLDWLGGEIEQAEYLREAVDLETAIAAYENPEPAELSREARVAATRCLDAITIDRVAIMRADINVFADSTLAEEAADLCDEAVLQIDVDNTDAEGLSPLRALTLDLLRINIQLRFAVLSASTGGEIDINEFDTEINFRSERARVRLDAI